VHDSSDLATAGFANGERYQSARPDYPVAAVEYLVRSLRVTERSHVVDLGAGTGIFTEQLVPYGCRITAVEPTAGMRAVLAARLSSVEVLDGRDVEIPLASRSVDCVVVAQAFHWFDAPAALEEIHRVLVAGGGLGLIWNERDESVDWVADLGRAMRWPQNRPYDMATDYSVVLAAGPFEHVERRVFSHHQTLDHETLLQRVLTSSYIAVMAEQERHELMTGVAEVVRGLPDRVELPYVTTTYRASATRRHAT
jgi:SAM-dependent methyltransferase